jgi:transglutaminase-like putative cysteine protease
MEAFLTSTDIIDYRNEMISHLANQLAKDCTDEIQIAKRCFEYVRDKIRHSGDFQDERTTCKASEVLAYQTGWCYAISHLLAALFRANGITGLCYQRLSCSEYVKDAYCLHGLNAIYLKAYGWNRVDARGNKEGIKAEFNPPHEQLAFTLEDN